MLHTKFYGILSTGSRGEDFEGIVLSIYGHDSHLGHATKIVISMYSKAYIQNLVQNGTVIS